MDFFDNLGFWEIIGPAVATIATIFALFGSPFKESKNGKHKLTSIGYICIILASLGLITSIVTSYKSNVNDAENNKEMKSNFDSILHQNKILLSNDSLSKFITDSLNSTVNKLRDQLINISIQELEKERSDKKEYYYILKDNLYLDISINIDLIEGWKTNHIEDFKKTKRFLTGRYQYDALIAALNLPLRYKIKEVLKVTFEEMKISNELIENILKCTDCDSKEANINSLIRYSDRIYTNLIWLKNMIK